MYIKASKSSGVINGTSYLEKYVSNKWITETSWSISGTGSASLSKIYTGESEVKYRIKVVVSIDGEKVTVYSNTCGL